MTGSLLGEQGELFGPPLRHIKPSIHAGWVSEQLWKPVKPVNAEGLSLNNNQKKKKNSVQGDWIRLPQEWPLPVAPSRLRHTTTGAFFFFFSLYFSFLSTIFSLKSDQGTKQENDMTEEEKKNMTWKTEQSKKQNTWYACEHRSDALSVTTEPHAARWASKVERRFKPTDIKI